MRILAIETSCDETGAAVVEKKGKKMSVSILSNITASSANLHAKTGGIIPENASREQVKSIIPVVVEALLVSRKMQTTDQKQAFVLSNKILRNEIDAIAVTYGPGLIGPLLVGVETAKTLSFVLNKPIIPVHHLLAHLFANFIDQKSPIAFPLIGLVVSGGHTDLLFFESTEKFQWLGGTRDDAAGEALDKVGRILGLSYPAGAEVERRASKVKRQKINFQSPMIRSEDFDFSFSGLKSEVARFIANKTLTEQLINNVCHALQRAIFDVLIKKTIRASKLYKANTILLGGGVSANRTLRSNFVSEIKNQNVSSKLLAPQKPYAMDNAAMIGSYALLNFYPVNQRDITVDPELYFN
jgi:N6-L-threonylcarbamoyladenine synthase